MTKRTRAIAMLVSLAVTSMAHASGGGGRGHHGGHGGNWGHRGNFDADFGFYFGDPFWGGPRYYRPDYYQPPIIIEQREPPVYIQRAPTQAQATQLWYYCQNPAGYYPYVPKCNQQWVTVDPQNVPPTPNPQGR